MTTHTDFTAQHLVRQTRVGAPAPHGSKDMICWAARHCNETFTVTSALYLMHDASDDDASVTERLTTGNFADSEPAWAGDDLVFLSNRSGSNQLWTLRPGPKGPGKLTQLSAFPIPVHSFRVARQDDRWVVVFAADVLPHAGEDFAATAAAAAAATGPDKPFGDSGTAFEGLPVRHWDEWDAYRTRRHLFWAPLHLSAAEGDGGPDDAPRMGDHTDLMPGMATDCPTKTFGDASDFAVVPGGWEVVFIARPHAATDTATSTQTLLFSVPLAAPAPRPVTNPATFVGAQHCVTVHPSGLRLAFLSRATAGYESDRARLMLCARETAGGAWGEPREIAGDCDLSPSEVIFWADEGGEGEEANCVLYATADVDGRHAIVRFSEREDAAAVDDSLSGSCGALAVLRGPRGPLLAFSRSAFDLPAQLHLSPPTIPLQARSISAQGMEALQHVHLAVAAPLRFTGAAGEEVAGFVLKPRECSAERPVPVAVLVHGGPQGSFNDSFHYRWNPQTYTGAGFAVVIINFHGSTGRGQAFTDSITADWGGKPFEDIMLGVDAALAAHPDLDAGRVCALGASYGGYMMNWINGHTDRFRCLVNHDGMFDTTSFYYATEELYFPEHDFQGTPTTSSLYAKWSPAAHVAKWKTPTLVIHGGKDFRLSECEGIATFTALQRNNVPSRFLHFPDENHWVLKPRNSLRWHAEVIAWLRRWTTTEEVAE